MNIIKRIKARTPDKDKGVGRLFTVLGAIATAVLATGLIVSTGGIIALTVVATLFTSKAIFHGQKVLK